MIMLYNFLRKLLFPKLGTGTVVFLTRPTVKEITIKSHGRLPGMLFKYELGGLGSWVAKGDGWLGEMGGLGRWAA